MTSRVVVQAFKVRRCSLTGILSLAGLLLASLAPGAMAKEPTLTAIELYDGPSGAAYVQLAEVLINGKAEMKDCSPFEAAAADKSTYGKMGKVVLAPGGVLARGEDGVMRYTPENGSAVCVVPLNVNFKNNSPNSLSGMAEQAVLRATPIAAPAGSPSAAPPIKKGVTLVFVAAPNLELAEYLRARRAADIPSWQAYLSKYPASPHTTDAKLALATLFVAAGDASLLAYDKTGATATPSYSDLKAAKTNADQAHVLTPALASFTKLDASVHARLSAIVEKGRGELNLYHVALNANTAGYVHLQGAKKYSDIANGVDAFFPAGQALTGDTMADVNALEAALQSAEGAQTGKQYDQAFAFIQPYRAFAEEEPRVAAIIDGAYGYHLVKGNGFVQATDWQSAIKEFEKSVSIKDTAEAQLSLKDAREQLVVTQDKQAAAKALEASAGYQQQKDMLRAYEVLSNLPAAQRALVAEQMNSLEPAYIQSASQEAKAQRQAHDPIKGIADEAGIERAYLYLQRAYKLSENESFRDRMDLLGNDLSNYLLDQAKRYLAKPNGSGTELGWTYLREAKGYNASNVEAVRDAMEQAGPAHSMRSKLSIRVQFRDQTSQREGTGFAGQLENAIITGLESSGVPVKVVRAGETAAVEPDFQLAGDVIQHHLSVVPTVEPMDSKYLFAQNEVASEQWNKANRAYEKAQMELQTAQTALQGGETRGKKGEIKDLNNSVSQAQKNVEEAHVLLDSTPKTVTKDIIRNYTYTRKTIDIGGVIQLQFRIGDSLTGKMTELVPATKEEHKKYVLLENVKPEDTEGIKPTGTNPDPGEFMTALENSALDTLVAAVRKRVEELPGKIFGVARGMETDGDLDGAGESFVRYLNIMRDDKSPDVQHARKFLLEQFDMRPEAVTTP